MFEGLKVGDISYSNVVDAFDTIFKAIEEIAKALGEKRDFPHSILALIAIHEMSVHGAMNGLLKAATERMEEEIKEMETREPKEIRIPFPVRGEKS